MRDEKGLREDLAGLEHCQWQHWTAYFLSRLDPLLRRYSGGRPPSPDELEAVLADTARWRRQIETPYAELSDKEKDPNREWADKVLSLLGKAEKHDHLAVDVRLMENRCTVDGCNKITVSVDEYRNGRPWRGLRLLGSCKSTRTLGELALDDQRRSEALERLREMADAPNFYPQAAGYLSALTDDAMPSSS